MSLPERTKNGGGAFVAGPIGNCNVCFNKAEIGRASDGSNREVCEDCWKALDHGLRIREERNSPEESAPHNLVHIHGSHVPVSQPPPGLGAWAGLDSDERNHYLEIIRNASTDVIEEVVGKLVHSGVLHLDFHKIIQNERWFSVIDLRRIASRINPDLDRLPVATKEVTVKLRRKKPCQTKTRTIRIRKEHPQVTAEAAPFQLPQSRNQQNQPHPQLSQI